MKTFTVRDLRKRTGELIRDAEAGKLSVVTKRGTPVFVAVPYDDTLLQESVGLALAVKLFDEEHISLSRAAQMAGRSVSEMVDLLARNGIPVLRTTANQLKQDPTDLD
jgi:prevent-host-death family protein